MNEFLEELCGEWLGTGRGEYPTIDSFDYREMLRVEATDHSGVVQYLQRTWKTGENGEVPSHWETGFLRAMDSGIEVLDVQESGRAEILVGTLGEGPPWTLELKSTAIAGDPRMVGSARVIELADDVLTYEMSMSTDRVSPARIHLAARLTRRPV